MKWMIGLLMVAALLAAGSPAGAQEVKSGAGESITIRGFVSATLFAQDQRFEFSNGQNAEWAAIGEFTEDEWFVGGDVRNTRLTLAMNGPEVLGGWKVGGVIEMDFFGGFSNAGPFGDEMPNPQLRLAYADLTRGGTTVRIGQNWSPLFGNRPASLSHLGFPLGSGSAGVIGWRFPGIFLYQNLTRPGTPTTVQLHLAAMRGSWSATEGGLVTDDLSPGEASAIPQLEARLDFNGRTRSGLTWGAYAVGHYDRKDLSGAGRAAPAGQDDELTGTALEVGGRLSPGPLTLQGNVYFGESIGQQFGHITQFGDISGWGAWGQAGYAFTPSWSLWGFYGTANPDDDDVRAALLSFPTLATPNRAARFQNQTLSAMLRYSLGPYAVGLEWLRAETDWGTRQGTFDPVSSFISDQSDEFTRTANQIAFSVFYSF